MRLGPEEPDTSQAALAARQACRGEKGVGTAAEAQGQQKPIPVACARGSQLGASCGKGWVRDDGRRWRDKAPLMKWSCSVRWGQLREFMEGCEETVWTQPLPSVPWPNAVTETRGKAGTQAH